MSLFADLLRQAADAYDAVSTPVVAAPKPVIYTADTLYTAAKAKGADAAAQKAYAADYAQLAPYYSAAQAAGAALTAAFNAAMVVVSAVNGGTGGPAVSVSNRFATEAQAAFKAPA